MIPTYSLPFARRHICFLFWLSCVIAGSVPSSSSAQPSETAEGHVSIREQTIYIPYGKLNEVFEKQGRGVFVPYEEFQSLWEAARKANVRPAPLGPPVKTLITEIDNQATVSGDVLRVAATIRIDVLESGWHEIPLRMAAAAVGTATVDGKPARLVGDAQQGYTLIVNHAGADPIKLELELEYAARIEKQPGRNRVAVHPPLAAVNRWTIRIDEPGVDVELKPLVAATRIAAGEGETAEEPAGSDQAEAGQTVVAALVGATPELTIEWTPQAEGASGMSAIATVESNQEVTIEEGIVRTRTNLAYTIRRAELAELVVDVPLNQKVVAVSNANLRRWQIEPFDNVQRIRVELFEAAREQQQLQIDLEQLVESSAAEPINVPVVAAVGVGRQQGIVVVQVSSGLRGQVVERRGVSQIDTTDLPAPLANGRWNFSYRYAAVPFEVVLSIEKILPRISTDTLLEATLDPESLHLDTAIVFDVRRAAIYELAVDLPRGFEVVRVVGMDGEGVQPARLDSFHVRNDDPTPRLEVNLEQSGLGRIGLRIELQRPLADPNLQQPTGQATSIELDLPRPASPYLSAAEGRLVVHAPDALRVSPVAAAAFRNVAAAEAYESFPVRPAGNRNPPAVLAYRYVGKDVPPLRLSVERRKPNVTVRQLLSVQVEPGVARYAATFFYDVEYSGVDYLEIAVPAATSALARNRSTGVREEKRPDDGEPGSDDEIWRFYPEREFLGPTRIVLEWEQPLAELKVGETATLAVPLSATADRRSQLGTSRGEQDRNDRRRARRATRTDADRSPLRPDARCHRGRCGVRG